MPVPKFNTDDKAHLVRAKLSRDDARKLERLRISFGVRSWSATIVRLVRDADESKDQQ